MDLVLIDSNCQIPHVIVIQATHTVKDLYSIASDILNYQINDIQVEYQGELLNKHSSTLAVELGISSEQELLVLFDKKAAAIQELICIYKTEPTEHLLHSSMKNSCSKNCCHIINLFVDAGFCIKDLLLHMVPTDHNAAHVRHVIKSGAEVTVESFQKCDFSAPSATDIISLFVDVFDPICKTDVSIITSLMTSRSTTIDIPTFTKFLERSKKNNFLPSSQLLQSAMCRISSTNKKYFNLLLQFGGNAEDTLAQIDNLMNEEIVRLCLDNGAAISDEHFPCLLSTSDGLKILKMLRREYLEIDLHKRIPFCGEGVIPMYITAADGPVEVAEFIVSIGGAVQDNVGNPLHVASTVSMVNYLVSSGADVNYFDICGDTPLLAASQSLRRDNETIIAALLANGADVNMSSKSDGSTPLHLAVSGISCDCLILDMLVSAGASLTIRNNDGATPFEVANSTTAKNYFQKLAINQT